jgi:DNA-binding XRE family transcriptional regulator
MEVTPKRLKQFRAAQGWTQQEAADALGISLRTLVSLEHETPKYDPRPITLVKVERRISAIQGGK